jgi:hypothetical protein
MRITSGGNVTMTLDSTGQNPLYEGLTLKNTNTTDGTSAGIGFKTYDLGFATHQPASILSRFEHGGTSAAGNLEFYTSESGLNDTPGDDNRRMTIASGGNVGIGIGTPSYPLQVLGTGAVDYLNVTKGYILSTNTTYPHATGALGFVCADIGGSNYDNGFWWKKKPIGTHGTNDNIMRLDISGNLTVGTGVDNHPSTDTTGSVRFDAHLVSIHDVLPNKGAMAFNCANDTVGNQNNGFHWRKGNLGMASYSPGNELMRLTNSGTLSIGDNGIEAPQGTLELMTDGAYKPTPGSFLASTSDERTKKNITSFTSGLACVTGLRPTTFNYNGAAGVNHTGLVYGLIAQEVDPVAPFMIMSRKKALYPGEEKVDLLNVDYNMLPFMLINSIKELNTTISVLQSENDDLRSRLDNAGL